MKYPTGVPTSHFSDKEISTLIAELKREQEKRAVLRAKMRTDWVSKMTWRACAHPTANWITVGEVTVCSVYRRDCGVCLGTAIPVHGDKYEENVGIAVAFAKAMGEEVPDFV